MSKGGTIYAELCFECHGTDGLGAPLAGAPAGTTMAPPLAGSPRVQGHRDYVIKALLHGLTGPLAGRTYTQVMIPLAAQNDEWIAAVASYVRNSFGNKATFVSPADVAGVRAATAAATRSGRSRISRAPRSQAQPTWKRYRNAAAAGGDDSVDSGEPRGRLWFSGIAEAVSVAEVQFDAAAGGRLGGGGGGGRAQRPAGRARATGAAPAAQPPMDLSAIGQALDSSRFPAIWFSEGVSGSAVDRREGLGKGSRDRAGESADRCVTESNEGEIHPGHPDWIGA